MSPAALPLFPYPFPTWKSTHSTYLVLTAITLGVNKDQPAAQFAGYQASFWSMLALHGITMIMSIIFVE